MNKKQKFKKGDLVRVLIGHPVWVNNGESFDMEPENVGRLAIIDHSYGEEYFTDDTDRYCIRWEDSGKRAAWFNEEDLQLVNNDVQTVQINLIDTGVTKIALVENPPKEGLSIKGFTELCRFSEIKEVEAAYLVKKDLHTNTYWNYITNNYHKNNQCPTAKDSLKTLIGEGNPLIYFKN